MSSLSPHVCLAVTAGLLLSASLGLAQQGDRKDRKGTQQQDPIPADQIPPSPYLSPKDAIGAFKLAPGYAIESIAAEEDVHMVVALAFDANGRVWTAEMRSYMPNLDGTGEDKPDGQIRVLEDKDGDGRYETVTTFLDGLVLPRAVAVTHDGCLYTSGDKLLFIERNGLKPVGEPIVVDETYARGGNPEHKGNGLLYGHDNWYYNAKSNRRYRRIMGQWMQQSTDSRGQWGIAKDNYGRLYYNNNSTLLTGDQFVPDFFQGNPAYTPARNPSSNLGGNNIYPIRMTPGVNRAYRKGTLNAEGKLSRATAACGVEIYRGQNFPKEMHGMAFVCEPSGDLVKAVSLERDQWNKPRGSHPFGENEFLATTDEWFLPCSVYTAPDGSLWIVDMVFGLLQHKAYMTTYLRKQYASRGLDKPKAATGRIYRVRYEKNPLSKVPKLEGKRPAELVAYLAHPNGTVRDTAQRLIVELGDTSTAVAVAKLAADASKPLGQIHALWALEGLNSFDETAFIAALNSTNKDVVRTALNVMSLMRPDSEGAKAALRKLPSEPQYLPAQVRALAALGLSDDALALLGKNPKAPLLSEAMISGLGNQAHVFKQQYPDIKDKNLKKHIAAATKKAPANSLPDGAHLKGNELAAFKRGKEHYVTVAACFGCHGEKGEGIPNLGPPLAKSEWVTGDADRLAKILLHGMSGPVKVNGKVYKPAAAMPGLKDNSMLTDAHLADVMTYVRNSWGNKAKPAEATVVKKARVDTKDRFEAYTEKDFK